MKTLKLYRIYKHINKDFNHLYIEIISDENYYEAIRIFTIKWQQNKGEHQYYAMSYDFNYDFNGRKIDKFYKITKKLEKQNISSSIQPYEMVLILEKMGFRQCEYYDSIGFTECEKVKNPNNLVYHMTIDGRGWTTKLANKRSYKKQMIKKCFSTRNGFSKVEFEISQFNDKVKSLVEFDIKTIHREYILYKGTDEEKEKLIRKEKLERIIK